MKILRAEECGFCFGVRRAIEMATEHCRGDAKVYSLGPIIHNPQVIDRLSREGLRVIDSPEEADEGTVIIRSHGVPETVIEEVRSRGLDVVDATCPLVRRAQKRAKELADAGYALVIVGERDHPEVQAIVANIQGSIVMEEQQLPGELHSLRKIGVIAQTTQTPESFRRVIHRLIELPFEELRAFNTICTATVDRQQAALALARQVDVMFVLGGRNSANTARLAQLCDSTGVPTFHLETVEELTEEMTRDRSVAGVTAGASTPDWIINEFVEHLEGL